MIPRDLTPGSKEWVYEALSWQERLERVPNDFGEPHKTNPAAWASFSDWERSPQYLLAEIF